MKMNARHPPDSWVPTGLEFLQTLLGQCRKVSFAVRLWDGTRWSPPGAAEPCFTLVLKHPGALRRMFWPPNHLTLGQGYIFDDFDVEGDLFASFDFADELLELRLDLADKLRLSRLLRRLPGRNKADSQHQPIRLRGRRHAPERDARAVTYHYNLSNDFYRLWLDERMIYSCAYFTSADQSLAVAQRQKLDYLCRKLRLRPGERLLDIGCGWGGLILHAAQNYGVDATGITLSAPQAQWARERISQAWMEQRCRVEVMDYRQLQAAQGYDKIVSVGMCEHVGAKKLSEYFSQAFRLLRPRGVFLNHGIAVHSHHPPPGGPSFIDRYVFPDGELFPIATTLNTAEGCGFEVRDLENLREHYALTLRHWVRNLESRHAEAVRLTNELTYRIWRIYMAGSAHGFASGSLNLYQALLVKAEGGGSGLPLTRSDWYR